MRSMLRATVIALALTMMAGAAKAQQAAKIAYVNTQALMDAAPGRAAADAVLDKEGAGYRAQVQKMQDSINTLITAYQKDEPTLSATAKDARQKAIQSLETDAQAQQLKFQQAFSQRSTEVMAPITDIVKKALDDIRAEGGYAMILANDPQTTIIVSADKNLDITDRVVATPRDGGTVAERDRSRASAGIDEEGRSSGAGWRHDAQAAGEVTVGSTEAHDGGGEGEFALTAAAIAEAVGGTLVGDPGVAVVSVAPLDRATRQDLSFFGVGKYTASFRASTAGVVLISPELADSPGEWTARIIVDRPQEALLRLLPRFDRVRPAEPGVHPTASIAPGAALGDAVSVGPYAVIGEGARVGDAVVIGAHCVVGAGVEIGEGSHLYPSVTLYSGSVLGARVAVHSGARIGSDGFGYVQRSGQHLKIPHVGRCILEDDVEIGANTTIDRGSIDDTVVGAGTKIDNLVQVAHNVRIGRGCLIMAQAGIAGSARLEDGVMILGQAGIGGHVTIGKGARVGAQGGVFGDIPAGETWSGYPARPHKVALRAQAALFKLPGLLRRIERLLDSKTDTE